MSHRQSRTVLLCTPAQNKCEVSCIFESLLLFLHPNHLSGAKMCHFLPVRAEPSRAEPSATSIASPCRTTVRPSRVIAQLTQNTTLSCPCHSVRSSFEGPRQQAAGYCRRIGRPPRLAADFLMLCVCRQTNHGDGCDVLQACSQNMDWMMDGEREAAETNIGAGLVWRSSSPPR